MQCAHKGPQGPIIRNVVLRSWLTEPAQKLESMRVAVYDPKRAAAEMKAQQTRKSKQKAQTQRSQHTATMRRFLEEATRRIIHVAEFALEQEINLRIAPAKDSGEPAAWFINNIAMNIDRDDRVNVHKAAYLYRKIVRDVGYRDCPDFTRLLGWYQEFPGSLATVSTDSTLRDFLQKELKLARRRRKQEAKTEEAADDA